MKTLLVVFSLAGLQAFAQMSSSGGTSNPLTAGTKYMYNMSKSDVLKAAQEMPEENYSFKPVGTVELWGVGGACGGCTV